MKKKYIEKFLFKLSILVTAIFSSSTAMLAQHINLNGEWSIIKNQYNTINISNVDSEENWETVKIPSSWHLLAEEFMDYAGSVWYKKLFDINKVEEYKRYIIHFGAVDYLAKLFVNKKFVGEHEGGYTPFEFDVTRFIKDGNNEILLRVIDPAADSIGTEEISYWNIPHGKQSWYVQNSGIWQSVFISIKPGAFVSNVKISPKTNGEFNAEVFIDGEIKDKIIFCEVLSPKGEKVFATKIKNVSNSHFEFVGKVENPVLWDTENPNLYTIKINYGEDLFSERFGFREFNVKDGNFYLNGNPFYMIAALDQNFYPETVYQIPSEDYLRDEMTKAKQLGLNTLRCHIKVPEPEYLKIADEIGLLVWYEIPNWDILNESAKERARFTLDEMLKRDWNHPSLIVLSIINESWGIDLSKEEQRNWLKSEFNYAKEKAVGRLVVDNSACWGNFHLKTDINDYHTYWSVPENYEKFSETVKEVATRPAWLFSKYGDAEENGKEVLMLSEFGNWGLPKLPPKNPFWFNRKFGDAKVVLPEGVLDRFNNYKYSLIFNSYDELAEESQRSEFKALKFEIEEIRLQNPIQGYVITEFTDINWECNGILDMWRNFKENKNELSDIQQPDILIPRSDKFNYYENETAIIKVFLSHYSNKDISGAKLFWNSSNNQNGIFELDDVSIAAVKEIADIELSFAEIETPEKIKIDLKIVDRNGIMISKNFYEIYVFPLKSKSANKKLAVYSNNNLFNELSAKLRNCGYQISNENKSVIITNSISEEIIQFLNKGVNVICLADSNTKFIQSFPLKLISRDTEWLDGNWASNMNWLSVNKGPFLINNFGKTAGFESTRVIPNYVLSGIQPENYEDVLAGMFVGWIHSTSSYIVQMKAGKGNLITTTFKLAENYGSDPYATTMLDNIIEYVSGNECNPKFNLN
jgi:hypothetical protein